MLIIIIRKILLFSPEKDLTVHANYLKDNLNKMSNNSIEHVQA